MGLVGLVAVLATAGSVGGACACGRINDDGGSRDAQSDSTDGVTAGDARFGSDAGGTEATLAPSCPDAGDSDTLPRSCGGGPGFTTSCGVCGENCCASDEVEGGTYFRTYDPANDGGAAGEADPASVSGFRLDRYLVTVGRFRQFVDAWNHGAGYVPAEGSGKHTHLNDGQGLENSGSPGTYETGWDATNWNVDIDPTNANLACDPPYDTWTNSAAGGHEDLPINCVNWYESYAFCIWDGGFLPSEAEWEYAAAGGSQQREYPWGFTDPGTGNQYAIYVYKQQMGSSYCSYPDGPDNLCKGAANIAPVGAATLGRGRWGQLDIAGEVFEWILDWYASPYVDPCVDCAYLTSASNRVSRGGSFGAPALYLLASKRGVYPSPNANRSVANGFRCARAP